MSEEGSYQMKNMSDALNTTLSITNTTENTNSSLYRQIVGILSQHINQETWSHEVLTKLVGREETQIPHLVKVTVLQLFIPLLHEIDPQNPWREVEEPVKLQLTSTQTLNPKHHNQNTASQAREQAKMQRDRDKRKTREETDNQNVEFQVEQLEEVPPQQMRKFNVQKMEDHVPQQQMHKFNGRKLQRKQKRRKKPEEEMEGGG